MIWHEDEDIVRSPNLQLAFYEPETDDEALQATIADLLRARGATTKPHRYDAGALEVLGATGAVPPWMAESLESGWRPSEEEDEAPPVGALIELVSDGEVLMQRSEEVPDLAAEIGGKLRDTFWWLLDELRPLYGVIAINQATWDLGALDESDDLGLFAIGWVNLARVGPDVEERLRLALAPIATAEVAGGVYWSMWDELAPDGGATPPEGVDIAHRVLEALTGRTIEPPAPLTEEELDAIWAATVPFERPMVWVWDAARDETALLAGVAACSDGWDVRFGQGEEGWRCAVVDLLGAEDDEAMAMLECLAEQMAPSWISVTGASEVIPPGAAGNEGNPSALDHVWLRRDWLGEEALAQVEAQLAGAYRAEHAGGVYLSSTGRFNPSGQVPDWDDDEAFDRGVAAAAVVAEVARRSRGLVPPGHPT